MPTELERRLTEAFREDARHVRLTHPDRPAPDREAYARPAPHRTSAGRWLAVAAAVAVVGTAVVVLRSAGGDKGLDGPVDVVPPTNVTPMGPAPNGWLAYSESDPEDDSDVFLVDVGGSQRRIAGSGTDDTAQVCPAFSPDGRRLVYGQVTGSEDRGYEDDAEVIVTEVAADGMTSTPTSIRLDELGTAPCPLWSPNGRWLALGADTEVWIVDTTTDDVRRLTGHRATDLDWVPGSDELAIADSTGVHLYSTVDDEVRPLGLAKVNELAWSPDGTTLAFTRGSHDRTTLWLADSTGSDERPLAGPYRVNHGVGPVWSPDGSSLVYQRVIGCCESHEVVVVAPDGSEVVVPPPATPGTARSVNWYPWSVTWSPDGSSLLYIAWSDACYDSSPECGGRLEQGGLLAVPVEAPHEPSVLAEADWLIGANDREPWFPMQSWGRRLDG